MRRTPPQRERCPVCHRQHPVDQLGYMFTHDSGSRTCSGSGKPGPTLAKTLKEDDERLAQERALVVSLASCLLAFDMNDGLYQKGEVVTLADVLDDAELNDGTAGVAQTCDRGHHLAPKKDLGFIEGARAALFAACQARPELLDGTALTIQAWDPEAVAKAGLLAGPVGAA